jgi:hypothetical protein
MTISGHELVDRQGFVLGFDVDAANAWCEQQSLDSVDVRSPLADQPAPLTMRAPQILLVDTWNAHQRPNVPLAPAPGDQRSSQHLDVDSIGLNSSRAPVDLEATRVDHKALDAARLKEPSQPERVIAYLVTERDRRQGTVHLGPAVPGCSELRHQLVGVSAFDWIKARLLPIPKLDRQKPAVLAQFPRAVQSVRRKR